ncbi:Sodium:neurotransmitter symporter family protein [Thalassoglobus neptunius]|uniref:Transporter n=1 Tax=Thalassoglobus neptunius TaxID=1938619 RepID=A0A5C5X0R6_9PLAN|nr:sodium-dependent transporter [Thalassoglobus neptunius]TWT55753.1 Sodium:neurotransmitter symporter family protein [Thalassoglobus neptunius]
MAGQQKETGRSHWKSRFGFVLAAAGSAVGLGNIWKFPYITGENGGGLFVLIYLVCILLVGLPIMIAEIMIGRAAQKQPVGAFEELNGGKTIWSAAGWMGVLAGFIILSFYVVVAGWSMDYTLKSIVNFTQPIEKEAAAETDLFIATADMESMQNYLIDKRLADQARMGESLLEREISKRQMDAFARFQAAVSAAEDPEEARRRLLTDEELQQTVTHVEAIQQQMQELRKGIEEQVRADVTGISDETLFRQVRMEKRRELVLAKVGVTFGNLYTNGWQSLMWAFLFMALTVGVVAGGVSAGIERACQILMPTLFALICTMVLYGAFQSGFPAAVSFVFSPDPSRLKPSGVLEALGHAFFTLSLGMGAMMTYGSYQSAKTGLFQEALMITFLDTLIALLACLMIFPITFSYGQEPTAGPGLVFMSMPLAFAEIGTGGMLLSILFFGLLFFAALTSALSLLEVCASYLIDQKDWSRPQAALATGVITLLVAVPSAFDGDPDTLLGTWHADYGKGFFDTVDHLASNWMLPLGGLLIAVYAGWVMPRKLQEAEVKDIPSWMFQGWLFVIRIVAPALVVVVLLQKVGIFDVDELVRRL